MMELLALALATFVSEDLACISAGILVARGDLTLPGAITACLVGIVLGDLLLYGAGRWIGRPVATRAPIAWFVRPAALEEGTRWFARRGAMAVLLSRFVPGTRLPTYLAAGVVRAPFRPFALACLLAGALWVPLLVILSALLGESVRAVPGAYGRHAPVALWAIALAYGLLRLTVSLSTWRGRRLLLGRWRRIARWEFWPRWAFYPPVLLYILWLAVRHRSIRLITCVNPAMPGGGVAGESKHAILQALQTNRTHVARTARIGPATTAERRAAVRAWMHEWSIDFPVVLKPDVGERGGGVRIIRSAEALEAYFARARGVVLLQPFVAGVEAGLFYYRLPGEAQGHIFAITEKHFPEVVGDGVRTLEELILADDRAVCHAPLFLKRHADQLTSILSAGQIATLTELGTHSRGATFFDGSRLHTPKLEAAVHTVSSGFPGFWFGRYDVRAPSWDALRAGAFTVLELNGATSEATSIYDPRHGVVHAYRTLFRQWALLFQIARLNRNAGATPTPLREMLALWQNYRLALAGHAPE